MIKINSELTSIARTTSLKKKGSILAVAMQRSILRNVDITFYFKPHIRRKVQRDRRYQDIGDYYYAKMYQREEQQLSLAAVERVTVELVPGVRV